jgi:glycosyltransferase involved in cell wall biosynthesis
MIFSRPPLTIDVVPLLDDQWTGIPVFTQRLVLALRRHGQLDLRFGINGLAIPADDVEGALRAGTGVYLRDVRARLLAARRQKAVDRRIPIVYPSVKRDCGLTRREASTVHDLSTLFMPEHHEDGNVLHHIENFQQELATDEVVFCASEATRAALSTAFPSASPKTRVLHQYVEWPEEFPILERNLPRLALGRYALVVGTIEPRKNLRLILQAVGATEIARSGISFVIIGRKGWLMERALEELTPAQRDRVRFTGFVSEFTKYRLLKHAEFLVYPSLYEGFGIPAVEAMSLGKPVLAARSSSFPEVIGDAGVYFDPVSVAEFTAAFKEIQHPKKLKQLGPKALTQAATFSWPRMAQPVVDWVSG